MEKTFEVLPKDVRVEDFHDSSFQNMEAEIIARNICYIQNKMNPKKWLPFTWKIYKTQVTHRPTKIEKELLEVLVNGGRVPNSTSYIESGYLTKNDSGEYMVTEKFLEVIQRSRRKKNQKNR